MWSGERSLWALSSLAPLQKPFQARDSWRNFFQTALLGKFSEKETRNEERAKDMIERMKGNDGNNANLDGGKRGG